MRCRKPFTGAVNERKRRPDSASYRDDWRGAKDPRLQGPPPPADVTEAFPAEYGRTANNVDSSYASGGDYPPAPLPPIDYRRTPPDDYPHSDYSSAPAAAAFNGVKHDLSERTAEYNHGRSIPPLLSSNVASNSPNAGCLPVISRTLSPSASSISPPLNDGYAAVH